jgi:transcriptional regulator with XRE-family HTH domain
MQTFAEALTAELAAAGVNHTEAAERIGMAQPTISYLCSGTRRPTLDSFARVVGAYPRMLLWFACYVREQEPKP